MRLNSKKQLNNVVDVILFELHCARSGSFPASLQQRSALAMGIVMMQNDGLRFTRDTCQALVATDSADYVARHLVPKKGFPILKAALLDIIK